MLEKVTMASGGQMQALSAARMPSADIGKKVQISAVYYVAGVEKKHDPSSWHQP